MVSHENKSELLPFYPTLNLLYLLYSHFSAPKNAFFYYSPNTKKKAVAFTYGTGNIEASGDLIVSLTQ
jgi:hypothetical protein